MCLQAFEFELFLMRSNVREEVPREDATPISFDRSLHYRTEEKSERVEISTLTWI